MLQIILKYQVIFFAIGVVGAMGTISKIISQVTVKKLVKEAENMNKSNHILMRLIRAKFEHACMVSDRVENVGAFVDKYLYEYKVLKIKLYSWRQLEVKAIWLCGILGAIGAFISYYVNGMNDSVLHYGAMGGVGVVTLFLIHIATDEKYYLNAARVYIVDYLDNVCSHRYAKAYQKDRLQEAIEVEMESEQTGDHKEPVKEQVKELVKESMTEAVPQAPDIMSVEEEQPQKEAMIREILAEFLA